MKKVQLEDTEIVKKVIEDKELFLKVMTNYLASKHPKVYFARCGEYIKVGTCSSDISPRLSELQVGNPYKLELEAFLPGDSELERRFHNKFNAYWERGEWFKMSSFRVDMEIREYLKTGNKEEYGKSKSKRINPLSAWAIR